MKQKIFNYTEKKNKKGRIQNSGNSTQLLQRYRKYLKRVQKLNNENVSNSITFNYLMYQLDRIRSFLIHFPFPRYIQRQKRATETFIVYHSFLFKLKEAAIVDRRFYNISKIL